MQIYKWNNNVHRTYDTKDCSPNISITWAPRELNIRFINNLDSILNINAKLLIDNENGDIFICFIQNGNHIGFQIFNVDDLFIEDNDQIKFTLSDIIEAKESHQKFEYILDTIHQEIQDCDPSLELIDDEDSQNFILDFKTHPNGPDTIELIIPYHHLSQFLSKDYKLIDELESDVQELIELKAEVKLAIAKIKKRIRNI